MTRTWHGSQRTHEQLHVAKQQSPVIENSVCSAAMYSDVPKFVLQIAPSLLRTVKRHVFVDSTCVGIQHGASEHARANR